ncbi:MAG: methylmalonyl-CoA mutase small subunit [Prevotellaceae bacterium]|jgi:methylmalonyl-CoA mutase|nr:methylmalonyl-CoA mutase small subunit [Prevotellaceae bacterium]
MAEKKLNLLADFPAVSTEQWKEKVIADLKGADFDKKLVWKTTEGFAVQPFYRVEDIENLQTTTSAPASFPFVRGTKDDNDWLVRQDIDAENAAEANKKALDILNKGVNSLGFKIAKDTLSAKFIEDLLADIQADAVELNFRICVTRAKELTKILVDYFQTNKYDLEALQGSINFDPINKMLTKGKHLDIQQISEWIASLVKEAENLPNYRVVNVNAVSLSDAGAYSTQELGYALAWGVQYLNILIDSGIDACTAAKSIKFNFGVGGNYFMEIAKFRAARLLWAKIVEQYKPQCTCEGCTCQQDSGLDFCPCAAKMKIHAQTSLFNMAIFDAHVNLLRSQTEAMSAGIAGVDSLAVTPFDVTYKEADEFSEHIARNQQLLLKEESHFNKVVDVSAGSYYIENLTISIAEQAWKLFLETEEKSFFNLVVEGKIQQEIKKTSDERLKKISSRRDILLGTNQYPNFTETANAKIALEDCGCSCEKGDLETLPKTRAAEQFEQLRLATESSGKRPKVFMLTIGNLAMRLARAQFSSNFFGCAGYEIIDNIGFDSVSDGVKAAREKGANIIVLCSSDDEYAELAPAAYELVKGKEIFVVAGAPACTEELQKTGIEHFINVKSNVLETLRGFNEKCRMQNAI